MQFESMGGLNVTDIYGKWGGGGEGGCQKGNNSTASVHNKRNSVGQRFLF